VSILIAAIVAFTIASLGAFAIDRARARRVADRARIVRLNSAPRGDAYTGPIYNRHGRALGESI
jgi:hypothetical protein